MSNVYQVLMKSNHRRTITGTGMDVQDGAVLIFGDGEGVVSALPEKVVAVFPLADVAYVVDLAADGVYEGAGR